MTDTLMAPPPEATAPEPSPTSTAPTFDEAQLASAREAWTAAGFDSARFDAALAAPDPSALPPGAVPDAAGGIDVLGPEKIGRLSADQAREMAEELLRTGLPREQVEAALLADGLDPAAVLAPDLRTEDQKAYDAGFGAPGSMRPESYHPNLTGLLPADTPFEKVVAFHSEATAWAAEVGLPVPIGEAIIERTVQVARATAAMGEAERSLWSREQKAAFLNRHGEERAAELLTSAKIALSLGPQHFRDQLAAGRVLDDWWVVETLANHTERFEARLA